MRRPPRAAHSVVFNRFHAAAVQTQYRFVLYCVLASVSLAGLASLATAQTLFELSRDGRVDRIPFLEADGTRLLAIVPICRALGLSLDLHSETSAVRLQGGGATAVVVPGSRRVRLGDLFVPLTAAPRLIRGELYVPADFLSRVVAQLINHPIEVHGLRASVLTASASPIQEHSEPLLPKSLLTVVLDPGHGGKDTGASGKTGLNEKDVTLQLALLVRDILEKDPSFRVVLTRTDDTYLELAARTAVANQRGDCFVSIHLNSGAQEAVNGFEVYSMSTRASDKAALAASRFENQLAPAESLPRELEPLLWDIAQNDYVKESATFAEMMVSTLSQRLKSENRGAKQAPFLVLGGATIPAILVEAAFISHTEQEASLRTEEFRKQVAEALASGIAGYLDRYRSKYGSPTVGP